ncbi:MAG: response regulator [Patescibacteria group bacterium]
MPTPKRPLQKKVPAAAAKPATEKKHTILLVEDDTFLAGMYVTKLELEGFHVVLASDGEQAVTLALREVPDLMLLDIVLPKKSGFDVLKEVKANALTKNVPVILLTNLGQKEDVQKGLDLGALDYLIKAHFMPSEVVAKVRRLMK